MPDEPRRAGPLAPRRRTRGRYALRRRARHRARQAWARCTRSSTPTLGRRSSLKVLRENHRGRARSRGADARRGARARSLAPPEPGRRLRSRRHRTTGDPSSRWSSSAAATCRKSSRVRGSLTPRRALDIAVEALDGLSAVHAAGIVHRDVKLENLFLCDDGSVKLLDFGVAKIRATTRRAAAAASPSARRAPWRPSNARSARSTRGPTSTRWASCSTSSSPAEAPSTSFAATPTRSASRIAAHALRRPRTSRRVPAAIEAAILRAIAKSPDDRFPSASAMAEALRVLRGERRRRARERAAAHRDRGAARPISPPHTPRARARRARCASTHAAPKDRARQVLSEIARLARARGRPSPIATDASPPDRQAGERLPPRPLHHRDDRRPRSRRIAEVAPRQCSSPLRGDFGRRAGPRWSGPADIAGERHERSECRASCADSARLRRVRSRPL